MRCLEFDAVHCSLIPVACPPTVGCCLVWLVLFLHGLDTSLQTDPRLGNKMLLFGDWSLRVLKQRRACRISHILCRWPAVGILLLDSASPISGCDVLLTPPLSPVSDAARLFVHLSFPIHPSEQQMWSVFKSSGEHLCEWAAFSLRQGRVIWAASASLVCECFSLSLKWSWSCLFFFFYNQQCKSKRSLLSLLAQVLCS